MTLDFYSLSTVSQCIELRDELTQGDEFAVIKLELSQSQGDVKKALGARLNELRKTIYDACNYRISQIQQEQEQDNFIDFDATFHSSKNVLEKGSLHPITEVTKDIVEYHVRMGFDTFEGNQVETQYNNFTTVGTPGHHPARGMQDTFWLEQKDSLGENYVMRTQVTANLIPYATNHPAPFKVIFPGFAFRAENIDATHDINFHQVDFWVIDKNTTTAQLVTIVTEFLKHFFEDPTLQLRLRPSYFPFVLPTFEIDIFLPWFKGGQWVEVGGAGPIHKEVIANCGLDPKEWNGIAWDFGLTRLAQLKLHIRGLSQFYDGNLDFLKGRE